MSEKIDKIGKWSEDKLDLLKKYLEAYAKIMENQPWCKGFYYIDAFAGTGKPRVKDEERFIDGSPIRALTVKYPFSKYFFIEKSRWRIKKLESLEEKFSNLKIEIIKGDCNKILLNFIPELGYKSFRRALVFLDPFGMNLDWNIIKQLASVQTIEIFLNLPLMAMNRACLMNNPDKLTKEKIEQMNKLWGSEEWQSLKYVELPTLFGNKQKIKKDVNAKKISDSFVKRLKSVFSYVSLPLIMKNSNNAPLYCLIFAGHNEKGKDIIESIFGKFEKLKNLK